MEPDESAYEPWKDDWTEEDQIAQHEGDEQPPMTGIQQYAVWDFTLVPIPDDTPLSTTRVAVVTYIDHVEALRQAEERGYEFDMQAIADDRAAAYEQGQRDALAAIPDNDHGSDLDPLDYDNFTEYGLAVAREAIQRLIKGDTDAQH